MKHANTKFLAAAVLAVAGFAAVAQTPAPAAPGAPAAATQPGQPGGPGHRMGHRDPAKMKEYIAKRQAELKQKLAITPAQEGAWSSWTAAMQPPANWKRPDRAEFDKLTTPERIDRMRALRAERNAMSDKRADATKTFYAALSPEQKKVFDSQRFGRGGHRGHGPRHHKG